LAPHGRIRCPAAQRLASKKALCGLGCVCVCGFCIWFGASWAYQMSRSSKASEQESVARVWVRRDGHTGPPSGVLSPNVRPMAANAILPRWNWRWPACFRTPHVPQHPAHRQQPMSHLTKRGTIAHTTQGAGTEALSTTPRSVMCDPRVSARVTAGTRVCAGGAARSDTAGKHNPRAGPAHRHASEQLVRQIIIRSFIVSSLFRLVSDL